MLGNVCSFTMAGDLQRDVILPSLALHGSGCARAWLSVPPNGRPRIRLHLTEARQSAPLASVAVDRAKASARARMCRHDCCASNAMENREPTMKRGSWPVNTHTQTKKVYTLLLVVETRKSRDAGSELGSRAVQPARMSVSRRAIWRRCDCCDCWIQGDIFALNFALLVTPALFV